MGNFQGWIAFLSNGHTIPETPPKAGEITPWQKLLKQLKEDDTLEIKRISLVVRGVQLMSLPRKQCDGFFHAYEVRKHFFESMGEEGMEEIRLQGIGSVVGDKVFIQWINITPQQHVSAYVTSEIRDLGSCKIHTTLV